MIHKTRLFTKELLQTGQKHFFPIVVGGVDLTSSKIKINKKCLEFIQTLISRQKCLFSLKRNQNMRYGITQKSHKSLNTCAIFQCSLLLYLFIAYPLRSLEKTFRNLMINSFKTRFCHLQIVWSGNSKGKSIIIPLTSCMTGLDMSVLQIKTKFVSCHTTDSKLVKQEVNVTVIFPLQYSLVWSNTSDNSTKSIQRAELKRQTKLSSEVKI